MSDASGFHDVPTTTIGDLLGRERFMDPGIRPLWDTARLAGPAFTVRCAPNDNLMLHAAIYRAEPGSVIVVQGGDLEYALAGGNVCAIAHRRGIAGFVLDGLVRDIAEIRELGFPVFGRGVIPKPGGKSAAAPLNEPVTCGGVTVHRGDVVLADEDGVAVVPADRAESVLADARALLAKEAAESLDEWERAHRARVEELLTRHGDSAAYGA
ncbi:RraA family protein [Actinospica sp.]|uniref:RraA family protein n=1 Tax=Actinospica sp. TaxID=1872142 RepID=UPI002C5A90A1|nr:RraA family protein [Actinospica sp.]HWG25118.1 RraA family protein [Actinospica sp.]